MLLSFSPFHPPSPRSPLSQSCYQQICTKRPRAFGKNCEEREKFPIPTATFFFLLVFAWMFHVLESSTNIFSFSLYAARSPSLTVIIIIVIVFRRLSVGCVVVVMCASFIIHSPSSPWWKFCCYLGHEKKTHITHTIEPFAEADWCGNVWENDKTSCARLTPHPTRSVSCLK